VEFYTKFSERRSKNIKTIKAFGRRSSVRDGALEFLDKPGSVGKNAH